jgi:hypothetical protein
LKCGPSGIARSDLDVFRRDFVACARLAKSVGLPPRAIIKLLAGAGVAPAAAPPRCRQVFYRRGDVLKSNCGAKYRALRTAARS